MFVGFSCAILLILFFVFLATQRRNNISNNKPLLFVGLSFFVCLFPFITYGINIHNIEEGRYLYLSGIFLVLFLVMLLSKAIPSIANIFFCGLAGLCFIFLLNTYGNYWRSAYAITNNYCEEIGRAKCDSLIGINVPTDKYGAYIFAMASSNAQIFSVKYTMLWFIIRPQYHLKKHSIVMKQIKKRLKQMKELQAK
ncbi:MAG: hypothetical protein IPP29_14890 [Bacteroidetes bacterium]|nr:hypothetical protein [Bacteroidota bacterium]